MLGQVKKLNFSRASCPQGGERRGRSKRTKYSSIFSSAFRLLPSVANVKFVGQVAQFSTMPLSTPMVMPWGLIQKLVFKPSLPSSIPSQRNKSPLPHFIFRLGLKFVDRRNYSNEELSFCHGCFPIWRLLFHFFARDHRKSRIEISPQRRLVFLVF